MGHSGAAPLRGEKQERLGDSPGARCIVPLREDPRAGKMPALQRTGIGMLGGVGHLAH